MDIISCLYYLQKFENRALVVLDGEEKYWNHITIDLMTEESDENEDGELIMHELTWRSSS